MADNLQLNVGADGGILASATLTFSGDEAGVQLCGCGILSGSEGSWTFSQFVGGAGAVAAGVQRVTLASNDPAVVSLQLIDDAVYADDAPFTLTSSKVMAGGAIRDDSLSALAAVEGDVVPLRVGSTGALHVTGAGGGTQYAVDAALGATPTGTLVVAIRDDALSGLTPVEGDAIGIRVDANGALWVIPSGTTTVSGTVAATQSGTWNVGTVTTVTTVSTVTNLAQLGGQAIAMGTGARTAGTQRVTIATDDVVPVTNAALAVVGEGVITGATLRVTQATDDDGVAHLAAIAGYLDVEVAAIVTAVQLLDNAISGSGFNITQLGGAAVPIGAGTEAAAIRITLADNSTGTLTVDTTGTSGLEVVQVTAADLNMTEASASAIKTAVEVMDDWDETNRAKVNLIAGQAGIAAGAGAVGVTVPRTTLASDDPAVAALELIDNTVVVLGTATYSEATTSGNVVGAVRNDDLATLGDTDNEIVPLQTNSEGALYTTACASETKRASGVAAGGAPGTDDIVAAVGSRKIRILDLGLFATSATPNNVFLDNVDNDLLFNTANPLPLAIDADADNVAGFVLPFNPGGWFETDTVNEAVTLNSSAAQDIAWTITYIEVP